MNEYLGNIAYHMVYGMNEYVCCILFGHTFPTCCTPSFQKAKYRSYKSDKYQQCRRIGLVVLGTILGLAVIAGFIAMCVLLSGEEALLVS